MTQVFTGEGIDYYRLTVIKAGLGALKIGMRLNTAYTPKKLTAAVEEITGKKYVRGDYDSMIADVEAEMKKLIDKKNASDTSQ